MTSPLSSLGKVKKSPFQRPAPFRPIVDIESIIQSDLEKNSSLLKDVIPEDCADLLDDATTTMLQKKRSNNIRSPWKPSNGNGQIPETLGPSDMHLMSSMMGRISQLQLRVQFHEKELSEKDNQISMLRHRLELAQTSHKSPGTNQKVELLERENKKLRKQVYDMEEFLADYGMMWTGDSDTESDSDQKDPVKLTTSKVWQPTKSVPEFVVDYELIIKNIRDLNVLAGEGETRVHRTVGGAELKLPDPINLSLYANGFLMFNGPFRPFTDPITQQCVQDLMDGYFPTELQKRYPDGVLISVHDHRNLHYELKVNKAFEGQGQILGGDTKPSRLVPTKVDRSIKTTSYSHADTLSSDRFLSKLPSNVIKKGKVIDIRQAVSDLIQGEDKLPGSISLVNTGVVDDLRKSAKGERAPTPGLQDHCSTLRIKHADVTYVLVMKYTETVGDIRKHLREHCGSLTGVKYDLVTSYPRKLYSNEEVTLEQAGLIPNAMLHLQIRK